MFKRAFVTLSNEKVGENGITLSETRSYEILMLCKLEIIYGNMLSGTVKLIKRYLGSWPFKKI